MFAVAALVALTGFSATVDDLFNYVEQQGGTVMDLPQEMVTMMMQQQNSKEAESLKNIKSMKMGMIGNPTEAQKAGLKAIADEGIDDYLDIESLMAMMGQKMDTGDAKVFMQMNPAVCTVFIFQKISVLDFLNYSVMTTGKLVINNNIIVVFSSNCDFCNKTNLLIIEHKIRSRLCFAVRFKLLTYR